jgi:hypothetical protein
VIRLKTIKLEQNSYIVDIDQKHLTEEIKKLGGRGNVLILLDLDNIITKADLEKTLDRIDRYTSYLKKSGCSTKKVACMNTKTLLTCQNSDVEQALLSFQYECKFFYARKTLICEIVDVVETKLEYSDLKIITHVFAFLKTTNNIVHVFLVSGDKDFLLLTGHLKKYSKVKTHLMTAYHHVALAKGLADVVISYPRIFPVPENPPNRMGNTKKRRFDLFEE